MKTHRLHIPIAILAGAVALFLSGILDSFLRTTVNSPGLLQLAAFLIVAPVFLLELVLTYLHRYEK